MTKQLPPLILSLDTSCDETSAALVFSRVILANIIASQAQIHAPYGGVFPTLAKRAHQENITPVIEAAFRRAGVSWNMIDAIAVTVGPGLAPALEIGIKTAADLAQKHHIPLIAVNHIESHLLANLGVRNKHQFQTQKLIQLKSDRDQTQLVNQELLSRLPEWRLDQLNQGARDINWPILGIVVSGGHSEFTQINELGKYQIIGHTIDDAAGEALDKVGRMINLGYPAGPVVEELAKQGDPTKFEFPLPMTTVKNFNLSYSGLKTAALRLVQELEAKQPLTQQQIKDFAASFQAIVFRHLTYKLDKLLSNYPLSTRPQQVWLGGGVASNIALRKALRQTLKTYNIKLVTPFEKRLCGDNAAMIGLSANFKYQANKFVNPQKIDRRPNWSIDQAWEI